MLMPWGDRLLIGGTEAAIAQLLIFVSQYCPLLYKAIFLVKTWGKTLLKFGANSGGLGLAL
ncbi:hypothetical protein AWQ21_01080 [Picosynechococcus sp. PCC 7003]|nr:hypothetical protein AWQ21_01080 [Picosynechococcus sp. PCC 7003]